MTLTRSQRDEGGGLKINVEKMFLKSVDHAPIPLHPQQVDYFKGVCRAIDAAIRAARPATRGKGA